MKMLASVFAPLLAASFGSTALAADYDPPIVVDQAPEYTPVEVGSGWYLRGDIGYNVEDQFRDADFGATPDSYSHDESPLAVSAGIGYHFTDYLRADLNLGYLEGDSGSIGYDDGTTIAAARFSNRAWYGTANAYVDLGTYFGFTPYVGAGVGFYRSNPKLSGFYDDGITSTEFHGRSPKYSLAYSLDAGLAYQLTKNLSVDLGYQYLAAPAAEYAEVEDLTTYRIRSGLHFQQVKLGLRYDLW